MADDWYYTQSHERKGPVSLAKLKSMADEGWLIPNDLIWYPGMPNWVPAEKVRGLFGSALIQTLKGAVDGIGKHPVDTDSKLKPMPTDTKQAGTAVSTHTATHAKNRGPIIDWNSLTPRHILAGCGGFIAALGIAFTAVAHSPFALAFMLGGLALAAVGMHVEVGQLLGQAIENIGEASHKFRPCFSSTKPPYQAALSTRPINTPNIFADLPTNVTSEIFTTLLSASHVRVERIVSHGHCSPEAFWYDQDQAEWVIVLKGAARIQFEDLEIEMGPGSFLEIAAHQKHRVNWTTPDEPTVWLAVFYGEKA